MTSTLRSRLLMRSRKTSIRLQYVSIVHASPQYVQVRSYSTLAPSVLLTYCTYCKLLNWLVQRLFASYSTLESSSKGSVYEVIENALGLANSNKDNLLVIYKTRGELSYL